jgi:hypothetical protein
LDPTEPSLAHHAVPVHRDLGVSAEDVRLEQLFRDPFLPGINDLGAGRAGSDLLAVARFDRIAEDDSHGKIAAMLGKKDIGFDNWLSIVTNGENAGKARCMRRAAPLGVRARRSLMVMVPMGSGVSRRLTSPARRVIPEEVALEKNVERVVVEQLARYYNQRKVVLSATLPGARSVRYGTGDPALDRDPTSTHGHRIIGERRFP